MKPETRKLIITICRIALGAVFIFSGLMKCIDSWGTAQKVGDYLSVFGMDWLIGLKVVFGILLSALELTLGLMLVFGIGKKLVSLITLVFMSGFTLLTLYIAIFDPLDECGCFGEAVRISNWNSFYKNVALLTLSIIVWYSYRKNGRFFVFSRREIIWTAVFLLVSVSIGTLVYRHLPPVDMFPYKVGKNLQTDVMCTACMDKKVKLIYRDRKTGQEREFSLDDTEWYDSDKWEYIATHSAYDEIDQDKLDEDFALYSGEYNIAAEVAFYEGKTILIVLNNPGSLSGKCAARIGKYIDIKDSERIIALMPKKDVLIVPESVEISGREYPVLTMEPKTLGYLVRADVGIVTIENGAITDKKNCRNIR